VFDNYSRIGIARVRFNDAGDPAGVERLGIALEPEAGYGFPRNAMEPLPISSFPRASTAFKPVCKGTLTAARSMLQAGFVPQVAIIAGVDKDCAMQNGIPLSRTARASAL